MSISINIHTAADCTEYHTQHCFVQVVDEQARIIQKCFRIRVIDQLLQKRLQHRFCKVFSALAAAATASTNYTDAAVLSASQSATNYTDAVAAGKQDTISDLAAIRSGAALGATALQSYTETDPTVPAVVTQTYIRQKLGAWIEYDEETGLYYYCHEEE